MTRSTVARGALLVVGLLLVTMCASLAQEPQSAPMTLLYRQAIRQNVGGPSLDAEGHTLGFIPPPFKTPIQAPVGTLREPVGAPTSYDLRSITNKVPAILNQGSCGSCWAFATFASLETFIRPTDTTDFSENNLRSHHLWDYASCAGGHHYMSTAYLSRWGGPVLESQDPYTPTQPTKPASPVLAPSHHVQEVLFLAGDVATIKDAIMACGAAYVSYWHDTAYYHTGAGGTAYYHPTASSTNHAVAIIGWDDNYAKTNFKPGTQPPANGAWLVRNSWGSSWGDSGYFWCSYYDAQMGRSYAAVFNNAEPTSNYDHNYQYDPLGNVSALNTPYLANVFTASGKQTLRAVSFYTEAPGDSYTVRIYRNPSTPPVSGTPVSTRSGSFTHAGYHTVVLTTPVALAAGDAFTVSVQISSSATHMAAFEYRIGGITSAASASSGQSYYSFNGTSWTDLTSFSSSANFCIKAFTDDNGPPTAPTSVTISPSSPLTGNNLTATASGSADPDPGDTVSYQYQWAVSTSGGVSWSAWGWDGQVLSSSQTAKGQLWKARARATDGTNYSGYTESPPVTIGNTAPTTPTTCSIAPAAPKTADDLVASAGGSTDADAADTISYQYQWALSTDGGSVWGSWGNDGHTLLHTLTAKGQQWKARGRAWDGTSYSDWRESAAVVIGNTAPTAPTTCGVTPTTPTPSESLTASAGGSMDADAADTVSYQYQWSKSTDGGGSWSTWGYDGATLDSSNTSAGDQWKARARASDGTDTSAWTESAPVTIGAGADTTPPTITQWAIAQLHTGLPEMATSFSDGHTECRTPAPTCLIVSFDEPLDGTTFTPSCVSIVGVTNGDQSAMVNSVALQGDGSVARITLTGALPQPDRYTIAISTAVQDPAGNALGGDRDIKLNVLHGDANGNGVVDIGDMLAVRACFGTPVGPTVCRYDVNCNGTIDNGDMLAVRAHYGTSLPASP